MSNISSLINGLNSISNELGILYHIIKLPYLNDDPKQINYGVWTADTYYLCGEKSAGKSAGCSNNWAEAILGTIGETVERYAPIFYNEKEIIFSSYKNLKEHAIHPTEYALYHDKQYENANFRIQRFDEDIEISWFQATDLTNGKKTLMPGQFIYLPFNRDINKITINTSTGLASHTNYYKAILSAIYESIERDSFVITWQQELVPKKLIIDQEIQIYLDEKFSSKYEWHFYEVTYDINVPTILGFCIGNSEFGKFVAVGSSSRQTYGEALKKTIQEIGQAIPYFRYLLVNDNSIPDDDYNKILDFDKHAIFYTKRQDLWHVLDKWLKITPSIKINFNEENKRNDKEEIRHIMKILKDKNYNVLFKDLTTPDLRQLGFYSVKIFIPQLIQLAGAYPFYFLGGKRLYQVPKESGFNAKNFEDLNKYPHPFP
jgi:ribosomal protein S12 methylthiotransferase accessory factor